MPRPQRRSPEFSPSGDRRHRERVWGRIVARQYRDLFVDNKFLRDAPCLIRDPAVVADDEFDPVANDCRAILLHKQLRGGDHLLAILGERPGQRRRQSDFDCVPFARPGPSERKRNTSDDNGNSDRHQPSYQLLKCKVEHGGYRLLSCIKAKHIGRGRVLGKRKRSFAGSEMAAGGTNAAHSSNRISGRPAFLE
jgi:hypothetical protein